MKIKECYIENFGRLSDRRFPFEEGLNCLKGENGCGKTTLSVFIKVMLYGMSDTKKQNPEENDRRKYLPWSGARCGGTMTFEAGGRLYRAERSFGKKASEDSFRLYDVRLGRESNDYSDRLGEELFGIDADGFERTAFLSERQLSPECDNKSISAKLSDLSGADGDIGELDRAYGILEEQRKLYFKKGGSGEIALLRDKISERKTKLEESLAAERLMISDENDLKNLARDMASCQDELKECSLQIEKKAGQTAQEGYLARREQMRDSLAADRERRDELFLRFGGSVPSHEEINDAQLKAREAERLEEKEAELNAKAAEYDGLRDYFDGKITPEDADRARVALAVAEADSDSEKGKKAARRSELFKRRTPSAEEIDRLIGDRCAKGKPKASAAFILGIILSITMIGAGVAAGLLYRYEAFALCAVGAVLMLSLITGRAMRVKKAMSKYRESAERFILSVSGADAPLDRIYDRLCEMRELCDGDLSEDTQNAVLVEFATKFFTRVGLNVKITVKEILKKYDDFLRLGEENKLRRITMSNDRATAARLREQAKEFLCRFKIDGDDPYGELRAMLTEYERLCDRLQERGRELESYSAMFELGEAEEGNITRILSQLRAKQARLKERAEQLTKQQALTERSYNENLRVSEFADEIRAQLRELEERLDSYTENLEIIKKTKQFLKDSEEALTGKYLAGAKAGFEHYCRLFGNTGEYEMNGSFGVSVMENGVPRPAELYSRGSRELYRLAARLGLVDALYGEGEKPPLLLDDPFISFDDTRLAEAMKLICALGKERQLIYFTCSESRTPSKRTSSV